MSWEPVAKHGMTVDKVRSAVRGAQEEMLNDWPREQRAAGFSLQTIEASAARILRIHVEQLERDMPSIMRDLVIAAAQTSLH